MKLVDWFLTHKDRLLRFGAELVFLLYVKLGMLKL